MIFVRIVLRALHRLEHHRQAHQRQGARLLGLGLPHLNRDFGSLGAAERVDDVAKFPVWFDAGTVDLLDQVVVPHASQLGGAAGLGMHDLRQLGLVVDSNGNADADVAIGLDLIVHPHFFGGKNVRRAGHGTQQTGQHRVFNVLGRQGSVLGELGPKLLKQGRQFVCRPQVRDTAAEFGRCQVLPRKGSPQSGENHLLTRHGLDMVVEHHVRDREDGSRDAVEVACRRRFRRCLWCFGLGCADGVGGSCRCECGGAESAQQQAGG